MALLALRLVSALVLASPLLPHHDAEVTEGPLLAGGGVLGVAGAVAAIGEGADAILFNPAAIVGRSAGDDSSFAWDATANYLFEAQPLGGGGNYVRNDVDLVLKAIYGHLGIAVSMRRISQDREAAPDVSVDYSLLSGGAGISLLSDQVLLGADLGVTAPLGGSPGSFGDPWQSATFGGQTSRFGAIFRPEGRDWRVGVSLRPESRFAARSDLSPFAGRPDLPDFSRPVFDGVHIPWEATIGFAASFGPRPFNVRPKSGAPWAPMLLSERPYLRWSIDFSLVGPSPGALEPLGFASPNPLTIGNTPSLQIRTGMESELIPDRLVVRGGLYNEPPRYTGVAGPGHLTAGADVHLFQALLDWKLSASVDAGAGYTPRFGFSLGVWH